VDNGGGGRRPSPLADLLPELAGLEGPFTYPLNFLGAPGGAKEWKRAEIVLLPVPYDSTTSYITGTRFGPRALLEASNNLEAWDDELGQDTSQLTSFFTLPFLEPDVSTPEAMTERVARNVAAIVGAGKTPVVIGGEHSISLGAVDGVASQSPPGFGVLQFDAHADLRDTYQGSPFNHACVMRRIHERGIPIFQVGVRSFSPEEAEFIRDSDIASYPMREILESRLETLISGLVQRLPERLYVTIDVDCLDPSILPSTGTPEPGGLTWEQICRILRAVVFSRRILGLDLVELSPIPGLVAPDFLAAKLLYRVLGYIAKARHG